MSKTYFSAVLFFLMCSFVRGQINEGSINFSSTSNGQEEAALYADLLQESYANGDYELQKIYSDSLLLVANLFKITEMSILALNSQAVYYKNKGDRQKALEIYYNALEKCSLVPNNKGPKAMILVNIGNIYSSIGSYKKAIATMDTLLVVTDTIKQFSKIKASAYVGLSNSYLELDNKAQARDYALKAIELGTMMKDEGVLSTSFNALSDVYIKEKDYERARTIASKGLRLGVTQLRTKERAGLLLNEGIANFYLSNYQSAISNFEESLHISQDKDLVEIEMYCYKYLAKIFEKEEDFEKSYLAQKEYSRLRDTILDDTKETAIVDLEKEIVDAQETIDASQKETDILNKKSGYLVLYGSMAFLILGCLLFFFIRRKKRVELENGDLQKEFALLKQRIEHSALKAAQDGQKNSLENQKDTAPYKNSALTEEKRLSYKNHILQVMKNEKPYLNPDLKQANLALKLKMSSSHFSEVLHYCFHENFYNFINFYRVLEAQELLRREKYKDAKIISIAFDSGFKSKTTFNRVFKNVTGLTPSEYREMPE